MKKIHVVNESHWKRLVLASLVIAVFVLGALGSLPVLSANFTVPVQHAASIEQQLLPKGDAPELSVVKYTDKNETVVGGSFTITIIVLNYSNKTAFNVTVIEPTFPTWAFTMLGPSEYHYDRIEPGTEQVITYVLVSRVSGNFTLEPTSVTYYDNRDVTVQRQFTVVSNILDLTVRSSGPNVSGKFQALYEALATLLLLFTALGVLRYFSLRYYLNREKSGAKSS